MCAVIKAADAMLTHFNYEGGSVSPATVQREINEAANLFKSHHQALPEH